MSDAQLASHLKPWEDLLLDHAEADMRRIKVVIYGTLTIWGVTIISMIFIGNLSNAVWGDRFGLGQFVLEFLLVPPIVLGLVVALLELEHLSAKAKLKLSFVFEDSWYADSWALAYPKEGEGKLRNVRIAVNNEGDAVTEWWSAWISVPSELFEDVQARKRWQPHTERGVWESRRIDGYVVQQFHSSGELACYPEGARKLASFAINSERIKIGEPVQIRYRFFTNKGKPSTGNLTLAALQPGQREILGFAKVDASDLPEISKGLTTSITEDDSEVLSG